MTGSATGNYTKEPMASNQKRLLRRTSDPSFSMAYDQAM